MTEHERDIFWTWAAGTFCALLFAAIMIALLSAAPLFLAASAVVSVVIAGGGWVGVTLHRRRGSSNGR